MILNSDSVSSPSMGRLAALDQNARNQANQNTLTQESVAADLNSTQIAAQIDKSAQEQAQQQAQQQTQQQTQATATAQAPVSVATASKFLTYANQWFATHAKALNATSSYTQTSNLSAPEASTDESGASLKVTPEEQKSATTSVLKSLIYGVPLSGDAKRLISDSSSFIGLNGLSADMQKLAQESSNYVFDTPLGKMTQRDLKSLSQRIFTFVHNPSAASRNLVLAALQDIQGRQHEMQAQAIGQGPFAKIMTEIRENAGKPKSQQEGNEHEVKFQTQADKAEQTSSASKMTAEEYSQEQVSAAYDKKDDETESKLDLETQIKRLQNPDHEEDQQFLSNFNASHELLRDNEPTANQTAAPSSEQAAPAAAAPQAEA